MKLVAYLRVSGISQANDGFGIATQRDGIEVWAKIHGHDVVEWIDDLAVSGTADPMSRSGFVALIDMLYAGKAEGVVAYDMTRFARGLIEQEDALSALWDTDATVFTVSQGIIDANDEDGTRTLIRHIMGAVSQYQRTNLVMKAKLGRVRAKAAGQHTDGVAPYGWRIENKRLVPNPEQHEVLDKIRTFRQAGLSWYKIATELNARGIKTGTGGRWHDSSLNKVMRRADKMMGEAA